MLLHSEGSLIPPSDKINTGHTLDTYTTVCALFDARATKYYINIVFIYTVEGIN